MLEIGTFGGASALPIVVAQAVGVFDRAGLDVKASRTTDSGWLRDELRAGSLAVVHLAPDNIIAWADDGGAPVRAWLAGSAGPISLVAGSARSIGDLRGSRLGVDSPQSGFAPILRQLLAAGGVGVDEVELVSLGATRLRYTNLREGRVEATMLTLPWSLLAQRSGDRNVFEAHTVLSFLAARTQRARLIAGIYVLPYRHPVWLAKETSTLDAMSNGRLIVGVGVGALRGRAQDQGQKPSAHRGIAVREFDTFNVQGHRGRMMDEYINILDALWTQESASYEGEFVSFSDIDIYPKPVSSPRPAIWIGGRSEAAQDRTARLADGWFPSQPPVEVLAAGRERFERIVAELGRPQPTYAINIFIAVDADGDKARAAMHDALGHRFEGDEPLFAATFAGTPDEVRAHMQRYVDAGVRTFDLKYLPLTMESTTSQMRLLTNEVLPGLQT